MPSVLTATQPGCPPQHTMPGILTSTGDVIATQPPNSAAAAANAGLAPSATVGPTCQPGAAVHALIHGANQAQSNDTIGKAFALGQRPARNLQFHEIWPD
jgi:hypothetical protein